MPRYTKIDKLRANDDSYIKCPHCTTPWVHLVGTKKHLRDEYDVEREEMRPVYELQPLLDEFVGVCDSELDPIHINVFACFSCAAVFMTHGRVETE